MPLAAMATVQAAMKGQVNSSRIFIASDMEPGDLVG